MSRSNNITIKIKREDTGLRGAIFLHADHSQGKIISVRISSKHKDEALGQVFRALGDSLTDICELLKGDK